MNIKSFLIKLTQWEHWPTYMFYIPVFPYYLYLAIKNRSFTFFLLTNPGIHSSGNGSESKHETLNLVPELYRPISVLVKKNTPFKTIIFKVEDAKISYPLIAKPDMGFRGFLVKKINSEEELEIYFKKNGSLTIIIQELITFKNEYGIFYYRYPKEKKGTITSITIKKYLSVIGDGISSIEQLILSDKRAFLYIDLLRNIHQEKIHKIPKAGEEKILSIIGNHSKGTRFLNGNHLISAELELQLDKLNKQINGWYFGRLDIKFKSFELLKEGKDLKILEINGVIAEPTHFYDASAVGASYFNSLKEIKKNWAIISKISLQNKELHHLNFPKFLPSLKEVFSIMVYSKQLKQLNKKN